MLARKLNKNGPRLSEIGLGTWAMGGRWSGGWGPQDDHDSIATINKAIELGINWIDTAPIYGFGHAEEVVGRALKNQRDKMLIATKCGLPWTKKRKIRHDNSSESILIEIEQSLKRLQTEYIDLYQIHWPDPNTDIRYSWETVLQLKESGKVKYLGVSNFNLDQLKQCLSIGPVDAIQSLYNLLSREIELELLPWCLLNNVGVLAYSPMASGILTGRFNPANLAKGDWRNYNDFFREPQLSEHNKKLHLLKEFSQRHKKSAAQLSVAWVLNQPGITSAIVGARRPAQIEESFKASGWNINPDDLSEIRRIIS